MPHVNKQSTRMPKVVVRPSPGATRVGRASDTDASQTLGLVLVKAHAPSTDRVEAGENPDSLKLASFGGPNEHSESLEHAEKNQPSLSEVFKFFKEGTGTTPPPSSSPSSGFSPAILSGGRKDGPSAKEDLPPIATILSGPIRTQTRTLPHRATPSVASYTRASSTKGAKVEGGDDLLYFLASVAANSTDSDGLSTKVDFKFDDEDEVDELDSDSESGSESPSTAIVVSSRETTVVADSSEADEIEVIEIPPPPTVTASTPPAIKAIPNDMTSRFTPSFPWEFYACDIHLGLSLYDAECSKLRATGRPPSQAALQLLIEQIFDGARVTLPTFKRRRAEIETKEGRRLLGRFARMGRVREACFLSYLRVVRGDPWFKPSQLSSFNRTPRKV